MISTRKQKPIMPNFADKKFGSLIPSVRSSGIRQSISASSAKPSRSLRIQKITSSTQTEGLVLISEEDLNHFFVINGRIGNELGMKKDYVRAVNYINSCHKFINMVAEKHCASMGDRNNVFFLPNITNFLPLFPWLAGGQKNLTVGQKRIFTEELGSRKGLSPGRNNLRKPSTLQHEEKSSKMESGVDKEEFKDILKGHLDEFLHTLHVDLSKAVLSNTKVLGHVDGAASLDAVPKKQVHKLHSAPKSNVKRGGALAKKQIFEVTDSPSPTRSPKQSSSKTSSCIKKRLIKSPRPTHVHSRSPCPPLPSTKPEPLNVEKHEDNYLKLNHDLPRREDPVIAKSSTSLMTVTSSASSPSLNSLLTDSSDIKSDSDIARNVMRADYLV